MARPDCVFCRPGLIKSEVRKRRSANGYDVMVFEPLNPVVPGHLLVVPTIHVTDAADNPMVAGSMMQVAALEAQAYESANIITSIGAPATQSVFHLHLHVVPRQEGDGLHLPWTGQA